MRRKMSEKVYALLLTAVSIFCSLYMGAALQVSAAEGLSGFEGRIQDDAQLLTIEEEELLEEECARISADHGTSVCIVTTPDFGVGDIKNWQRAVFSEYALGAESAGSGVMLAVSMAERDWGLAAFGSAQDAFTTYGRERMGEIIVEDLSDGEYYDAFAGYLSMAEEFLSAAEEGRPYTEKRRYGEGWKIPVIIGVSFLLSLLVSAGVVFSWKRGMNTRVRQKGAMQYLKDGSFTLQKRSDIFLYHTTSRTKRQTNNDSGGGNAVQSDHSGTSGKF